MDTFVRLKQQASGWPEGCVTEEQKLEYLVQFLHDEGIELDPQQIEFNAGLRMIAVRIFFPSIIYFRKFS